MEAAQLSQKPYECIGILTLTVKNPRNSNRFLPVSTSTRRPLSISQSAAEGLRAVVALAVIRVGGGAFDDDLRRAAS